MSDVEIEELFEDLRVEVNIAANLFGRRKLLRVVRALDECKRTIDALEAQLDIAAQRVRQKGLRPCP